VGGLQQPSLKGSEGTGGKETSNEKRIERAFIGVQTFKTDQSETIDFGRFKTTTRPEQATLQFYGKGVIQPSAADCAGDRLLRSTRL